MEEDYCPQRLFVTYVEAEVPCVCAWRPPPGALFGPAMVALIAAAAALAAAASLPQQFDITSYGAQPGGVALCTGAVKQAVAAAAQATPAEVVVPSGRFLTGAFGLASGVTLRLNDGAVLLASTKQADYPVAGWPSPMQGWNWDPALVDVANCTDTGIVGSGTIDGQQQKWVKGYDPKNNFLEPITWSNVNGCRGECRPKLVRFTDCQRVTISGVKLINSPDWTQLYRRCDDVTLQGITVTGDQRWGSE
jgi:polygalacturonase